MGLAERKNKQKIGNDPRNLSWSQDTSRFSFQHLQKFGWDPSQGLGSSQDGNPNHIKVVKKLDASGIGVGRALKEGAEIGGAGEGLDAVLKRLKAAGTGPIVFTDDDDDKDAATESGKGASPAASAEEVANVVPIIAPEPRRIMAARNKYIKSKRLASQSPAAMAEILGIPLSALPSSGASSPVPTLHKAHLNTSSALSGEPITADSGSSTPVSVDVKVDDGRTEDMLTTAPISVNEYFRRKLAQKKAQREGLPVPEMSYVPEAYNEVAKDFEGKKIKFEMEGDEEDGESAPTNFGIGSTPSAGDSPAESATEALTQTKEQRKAMRRAAKDAAKAEKKRQAETTVGLDKSKKDKKRKRSDPSLTEEANDEQSRKIKRSKSIDVTSVENADIVKSKKSSKGKERASDGADDVETVKAKKEKKEKRSKVPSPSVESIQTSTTANQKVEKLKKDKTLK